MLARFYSHLFWFALIFFFLSFLFSLSLFFFLFSFWVKMIRLFSYSKMGQLSFLYLFFFFLFFFGFFLFFLVLFFVFFFYLGQNMVFTVVPGGSGNAMLDWRKKSEKWWRGRKNAGGEHIHPIFCIWCMMHHSLWGAFDTEPKFI